MNCVSSFRPLKDSAEIAANQLRAKASWEQVFEHITYLGTEEPLLASPKTTFIPSEQFPTIDRLLTAASAGPGWCALINADIVVASTLPALVEECQRKGIRAITSQRYEFEINDVKLRNAKVKDSGYDFFMSDRTVWAAARNLIPPGYRIGHNRWDNWILGFLNSSIGRQFVDVTSRRVIFHPRHAERCQPYHIAVPHDQYLELGRPPFWRLT